ncbi:DNA binding protein [Salmonella phage seszw]|nr:DNA binding protein [Salmonella phage seszw]QZB88216.1 DNA binding protein [Salmonella phage seszw]QZB88407.1 DNA binding protein [Salmonella phage seszw]
MKTLSKIYSDKETRNGIAVNKTYLVPVEQIYLEPGYNIREADEQHVEYFAQCWESGQPLPALTVIPDEKGIRILDGQHRYLGALRAIERGAPIVRIECKDFTGDEADKIAFMVSSSQGKQLDPFERAKAYTRLKGFGWTNEEIAKKVGRSVSDVQMHLSQISYTNAVAVTREHGDDAVKVIDEAVEEAKAQGKDKVTAKVLKSKKIKPVDRLIELLKPADHVILPAGHVVAEDEEFIQIPVADIHEVMAILEKM